MYPKQCNNCNYIITNKSNNNYHINFSQCNNSMASKTKQNKVDLRKQGNNFVDSRMETLCRVVEQDNYSALKAQDILDLEDDYIDEELTKEIYIVATDRTKQISNASLEQRNKCNLHFRSSPPEEQKILKTYSSYIQPVAQKTDQEGLHAGQPGGWKVETEDLLVILMNLRGRADAIEAEIIRRQNLPQMIVLNLFIEKYKPYEPEATNALFTP